VSGVLGSVVGRDTMPQARRARVRFHKGLFFN
jgi:hypothetical protein